MKVFFVCTWFPNRLNKGEGFFMKHYTDAISAYDDVTVFYAAPDPALTRSVEVVNQKNNKVEAHFAYFRPFSTGYKIPDMMGNSILSVIHLFRIIRRECRAGKPAIFHLSVFSPSVLILWYYKFFHGIPFAYSEHWDIPIRVYLGLQKNWLPYRLGMKLCSLFTSRVVVCSKAMKDTFELYGFSHNVDIISSVVYLNNKNMDDTKRTEGKKVILHVSSLGEAQKNVSGMVQAMAEVSKTRSDFEFHILGYGKEFDRLNALAASLGVLNSSVFFHGFVSDEEKRGWFERSVFHLMFSNFEGYSLVTAESIYYGRPVIATHCGGPEDFVNPENGLLVQPRDIPGLIKAIHFMLDSYMKYDPEKLRGYGERSFSPAVVGLKHHQLYEEILGTMDEGK